MKNYMKMIKKLIEKRKQNEKTIENQIRQLGEKLTELEPLKLDKTSLKEPHRKARDLAAVFFENRKKIDQIDILESEINDIVSESNRNKKEIREKKKEVKTHYEELGFEAYPAFQRNSTEGSAYEDLFSKVESFEKELTRIEKELKELNIQENKKTLINRVTNRSRFIYLQGLLKSKHLRKSTIYSNLGEKVYKSDFLSVIGDASLISNMKPVIEAQEMVELLAKKDESLLVKKSKLIDEIERLDGNTGAGSSTKELEIEVEKAEKQLLDLYSTLGQIYIDDSLDKEITDSEIDRIFSNIHSLSTENEDCNKQITKLEAAISIDQVEKDISDVNIRIDKIKNDIQEKQDEIETFAQRIKELEIEKKKQMKLRGSKDSLELQQPLGAGTVKSKNKDKKGD